MNGQFWRVVWRLVTDSFRTLKYVPVAVRVAIIALVIFALMVILTDGDVNPEVALAYVAMTAILLLSLSSRQPRGRPVPYEHAVLNRQIYKQLIDCKGRTRGSIGLLRTLMRGRQFDALARRTIKEQYFLRRPV